MMDSKPRAPGYVQWVTRTLEDSGYETWAVGGAVRNPLLGLPAGDWDMATRAPPQVVQKLFPRTIPIGIDHGTVGILTRQGVLLEITTFRRDVETTGRHAVVEFAESIQEDLARRDFTINAVAWHPIREVYEDPFQGRKDLEDRILRTVGDPTERFSEDYLRVLRGLRFSGRFRLRIDGKTWESLCAATDRLGGLSAERIREELMKVLVEDDRPSGALALYGASGVFHALFPELSAVEGHARLEGREDILVHSILQGDLLPPTRSMLRLASLLQGLGVPDGEGEMEEGPDQRCRERAAALMIRYRFSNAETEEVTELLKMGLEPPLGLHGPAGLRSWLHRSGPSRLRSFGRLWLSKARLDSLRWGIDPGPVIDLLSRLRTELRGQPPLALEDLALNGNDLIAMGEKPGPRFSQILGGLMERVLQDPSLNTKARLQEILEMEGEGRGGGV